MILVAQRTITGAEARPNVTIRDRRRRRLSTIVRRHADHSRPFVVSVHRRGQPVAANDLDVVMRAEWDGRRVGSKDIVLITYLPQGGGGSGGTILMAIAAIALAIIVPYAVGLLGGPFVAAGGGLSLLGKAVSTGIIMGSMALLSMAFKPKANKTEEQKPVYGVSGGGNLPRPGDRIPRLYGRCWTVPDLSQPDFFVYEGEEHQVLHKRMTVTLGRAQIHKIRVNGQTMATSSDGVHFTIRSPFTGSKVEVVNPGETCSLVPRDVVSSPSVQGNELARPDSVAGQWSGPFLVADPSVKVNKIQLDIQAPQGLMLNFSNSKGAQEAGADYGWEYQYCTVDSSGNLSNNWKRLDRVTGNKLSRRPVRWSRIITVPEGSYAVRGRNLFTNTPVNERTTNIANALQWDALRGYIKENRVRDHVTEVAIKVKSSSALGVTSFANVEIEATGKVPVWNGSSWSTEATRKAVWIFADIMRNATYGAGLPSSALDLDTLKFYADELRRFDTFDGVIRGPDSVWNVASAVLFPLRADPVQLGRVWSIVRDDRKDVRPHVITARQIVGGSSGLSFDLDPDNGESHYISEYYEQADPRRQIQLPDIYYGNKSNTPTRRNIFGVRSRDHATHLTKWLAASAFYRRQTVRFQTEYDGRIYKRGDPITVETWFASKMKAASVIGRSGDTLTLDRPITLASGDKIVLRDRSGREWGPVVLDSGAGDTVTLNAAGRAQMEAATGLTLSQALALDTMEETSVLIGAGTVLSRHYLVKVAKPSGRDRMDIEAVIDHPKVWDILDEPITEMPEEEDEPDPTPPRNLAITERLVLDGDNVRAIARLSFQRTSARALAHEVEYRIDYRLPTVDPTEDPDVYAEETFSDGDWIQAGSTSDTFLEIAGLPAAQIDVRVRAIYSADNVSAWAYLNNVMLSGTLKPPGDVTNLTASVLGDVMTLAWAGGTDVHFDHYEVRFSPKLSGVEWGTAMQLLERVATPGAQVPAASGTYLVKAVSRAGVASVNAAVLVSDVAGINRLNVIETFAEHPSFAGVRDNVIVNPTIGGLQLDYTEDVYARGDWYAPGLDWYLGEEGVASQGTYTFAQSLDLGAVYTSRVTALIEAYGTNLTDNIYAVEDVYALEDFYQTSASSLWEVGLECRTTNDDPSGAANWSDWRPVVIGDVTARAFQFRVRLASYEFGVTPIVTRLEVSIDMPDRQEGDVNVAVPAEGLRIDFSPPFLALKGLGHTAENMASGDRYAITAKDETGFFIRFFNSAGVGVARTFDYVAKGYGRKEA